MARGGSKRSGARRDEARRAGAPRGRHAAAAPSRKGPRLGVAKQQRVQTAGGRVGQWWTPAWLAEALARWAGVHGSTRVLDAGAGRGALTIACIARGAAVTAVEIDPALVRELSDELDPRRVRVVEADFLAPRDPRQTLIDVGLIYDVVVANPPWEKDFIERFMLRALELAPRAVFIVPLNQLAGVGRGRAWKWLRITRQKVLARRAKFGGASQGMRDVMLIEVTRRATERMPGEPDLVEQEVGE